LAGRAGFAALIQQSKQSKTKQNIHFIGFYLASIYLLLVVFIFLCVSRSENGASSTRGEEANDHQR
jgi:hypothetical protein